MWGHSVPDRTEIDPILDRKSSVEAALPRYCCNRVEAAQPRAENLIAPRNAFVVLGLDLEIPPPLSKKLVFSLLRTHLD